MDFEALLKGFNEIERISVRHEFRYFAVRYDFGDGPGFGEFHRDFRACRQSNEGVPGKARAAFHAFE